MLTMFCFACTSSLIVDFWRGRTRLQDLRPWCEALRFSLYKGKGDRSDLCNYRGIVLLDVVSKLVSWVINSRLVWVVEQDCGETENGYRKNCGATDCTFLLRRLLELWRGSRPLAPDGSQDFFSFLWTYRKRLTLFPASPFSSFCLGASVYSGHAMLRHLHLDSSARVCQQSRCSDPFPMATGVRQGSVEGPSLWLLFYSLLLHDFRDRCWHRVAGFGVPWLTNRDGVLRNRQAAASRIHLRDVVFADDNLLLDNNWANFQSVASLFDEVLDDYGSSLSFVKTEWMMLSSAGSLADAAPLPGCRVLRVRGVLLFSVTSVLMSGVMPVSGSTLTFPSA